MIHHLLQRSPLNNPHDLDPDYWKSIFQFNKLWHVGAQVNDNVALMVCWCSVLLGKIHAFWQIYHDFTYS